MKIPASMKLDSRKQSCVIQKSKIKQGIMVHICNPSDWKHKVGESQVPGQPGLHSEFQASLGYISRPCVKKNKKPKQTKKEIKNLNLKILKRCQLIHAMGKKLNKE
jgi:hypothetical protein